MAQFLITTTVAAGPTPISAVAKNCRSATIIACKSLAGPSTGPNTGTVKIGNSASAAQQPVEMNPGDERALTAPSNGMLDLSRFYMTVANDGDGLVIIHQ